jgi:hypothetical protein
MLNREIETAIAQTSITTVIRPQSHLRWRFDQQFMLLLFHCPFPIDPMFVEKPEMEEPPRTDAHFIKTRVV